MIPIKILIILSYNSVLFYSVLFVIHTKGISGREVKYLISNPKDVSLIPTVVTKVLTLLKPSEISEKPLEISENLRKIPKMSENYGNANVFMQPTNRKHFPLHGQFGLAASDYMYGKQRPEFYQCTVPLRSR
jgi:hypothetical protein